MTGTTKDYSDPRYDTVREHHAHPTPADFERFDARRAQRQVEQAKADEKKTAQAASR